MQPVIRRAAFAVLLAALPLVPLQAQQHRPGIRDIGAAGRHGFWGVFELGAGSEAVNFDNDGLGYSDQLTRPEFALRLGGTVSRHMRLGGEVNAWVNQRSGLTETVGGVLFVAQLYPSARNGFFLKGGAGLGWSSVEDDFGASISDGGFASNVGVGYDIRIGRQWFLVPTANLNFYRLNGGAGGDNTERVGTIGLGIAYQH
jgi:hypothetical protein